MLELVALLLAAGLSLIAAWKTLSPESRANKKARLKRRETDAVLADTGEDDPLVSAIELAGLSYSMTPAKWRASRVNNVVVFTATGLVLGGALGWVLLGPTVATPFVALLVAGIGGFAAWNESLASLKALAAKRAFAADGDLSGIGSLIIMRLQVGGSVVDGLKAAVVNGDPGVLRNEIAIILSEVTDGTPLAEAILSAKGRINSTRIHNLYNILLDVGEHEQRIQSLIDTSVAGIIDDKKDANKRKAGLLALTTNTPLMLLVVVTFGYPLFVVAQNALSGMGG